MLIEWALRTYRKIIQSNARSSPIVSKSIIHLDLVTRYV